MVYYLYAGGLGISMSGAPAYKKSILGDIELWTGYDILSRVGSALTFEPWKKKLRNYFRCGRNMAVCVRKRTKLVYTIRK